MNNEIEYIFPEGTTIDELTRHLGDNYEKLYTGYVFLDRSSNLKARNPTEVEKTVYVHYIVEYKDVDLIYKFNYYDQLIGVVKQ